MSCKKLDQLGLLSLEKRRLKKRNLKKRGEAGLSMYIHLMGFIEDNGASLFSKVH